MILALLYFCGEIMSGCLCSSYIYDATIAFLLEYRNEQPEDLGLDECGSIAGRVVLLFGAAIQSLLIPISPIIVVTALCWKGAGPRLNQMWEKSRVCTVFAVAGMVVLSPIAYVIYVIKIVIAAIIHPGLAIKPYSRQQQQSDATNATT